MVSDLTYHLGVTYFPAAILWDVLILDDFESFCPGNGLIFGSLRSFAYALTESAEFISVRFLPKFFVLGMSAQLAVFHGLTCVWVQDWHGHMVQRRFLCAP